jgi:YD repeat-containing protein
LLPYLLRDPAAEIWGRNTELVLKGTMAHCAAVLAIGETAIYGYDAAGRHVLEETNQNGTVLQDQTLSYDALGRLDEVTVANGGPAEGIVYDAVGNKLLESIRQAGQTTQTLYFAYNSMNQQILADGAVDNNAGNLANVTATRARSCLPRPYTVERDVTPRADSRKLSKGGNLRFCPRVR